ncbi:hypothetical protein BCR33DRAFT_805426 [Rhizoclosmatium globosum]|uniref:F-box domain-containing protein n=1 Tax=Rhizoclosmatium globosum TaxID=329046 RepID=A0A1Y2CMR2_9FUNG|nr:hypothetical protein BCR33DRAFT_805426 [Rhizoclosmatium globosum]|eukprot:ORY48216.1 hypothetical protein BCR33DRAFT_805426 [Rhizoclosmatium globosum]
MARECAGGEAVVGRAAAPQTALQRQLPGQSAAGLALWSLPHANTGEYADPMQLLRAYSLSPAGHRPTLFEYLDAVAESKGFLLDTKLDDAIRNGTIVHARNHVETFECSGCAHRPGQPWPALATSIPPPPAIHVERPFVKDLIEISRAKKDVDVDSDGFVVIGKAGKAGKSSTTAVALKSAPKAPTTTPKAEKIAKKSSSLTAIALSAEPPSPTSSIVTLPSSSGKRAVIRILPAGSFPKDSLRTPVRSPARSPEPKFTSSTSLSEFDIEEFVAIEATKVDRPVASGPFHLLPYEVMLQIMNLLPVESIITLSEVSRFFYVATQDGYLWRHLFRSLDSKMDLKSTEIGDWKHVYTLQMNGVLQDLTCFHRKTSFKDDVLGIPIEFTVNPVKRTVDYIHSTMDLLSTLHTARTTSARQFGQKSSVNGCHSFCHTIISNVGFLVEKVSCTLEPQLKSQSGFQPIMVLEVLPKLMNTFIVLLSDKGLHNSDSFLTNYFQIHRLFIALVYEFPQLKKLVLERLNEFARTPAGRSKAACPSLGDLIPLVAVLPDPAAAWKSLGPVFLKESFTRNVLWLGRHHPELATLQPLDKSGIEEDRIQNTFTGTATRCDSISSYGSTRNMAKAHDLYYGRPTTSFLAKIKSKLATILEASSFEEILPHFHLTSLPFFSPKYDAAKLTFSLRECVTESLRKGYHTKTTNFAKIHSSGVSKILRKGESYRVAPGTKSVVMEGSWARGGNSSYLDASVLLYDFDGKFLDVADFRQGGTSTAATSKPKKIEATEKTEGSSEKLLEVVFIIDITGSMGSQIEGVKQMINAFFDNNDYEGMRIHIWTYTEGGDKVYVSTSPAGLSPKELREYVYNVKLNEPTGYPGACAYGDDIPENVVSAVATLTKQFKATDNVLAFVITDASPHHASMVNTATARAETRWLRQNGFSTDIYEVLEHVIDTLNVTFVPILYTTQDIMWYQQAAALTGGMCLKPTSSDSKLLSQGLVHILKTMQEISLTQEVSDALAAITAKNLRGFNMISVNVDTFIPLAVDPAERDRLVNINTTPVAITSEAIFNLLRTAVDRFQFNGAIRHSGDIVSGNRGSHRITVDVKALPSNVQSLVFALSSWTSTLKDVRDPEVRLFDGSSLTELCRYGFDECATAGQNTCVVMCRLKRDKVGGCGMFR